MEKPRFNGFGDRNPSEREARWRREEMVDRIWGWIAGVAAAVLFFSIAVAGWQMSMETATIAPVLTPAAIDPFSQPVTGRRAADGEPDGRTTGAAPR